MTILLLIAGLAFAEPSACEKLDANLLKAMKAAEGKKTGPDVFRVIALKSERRKLKCPGPVPKLEPEACGVKAAEKCEKPK